MQTAGETTKHDQRARLNKLYRVQRHFYDPTRRLFLFGRDRLLRQMDVQPGERVLEVGCGTGRNLLKLSELQPKAILYGLDASDEMLKTAGARLDARGMRKTIILRQGLAEKFDLENTFRRSRPFDKVFISYSLSMFPAWRTALTNVLGNLRPGGDLFILDFWDGDGLPVWLVRLRTWWLSLFKAYYRPEFLQFLTELQKEGEGKYTVTSVGTNYAFIAHFQKSPEKQSLVQ